MDSNLIQWPRAKYWTAQWNPVIGCRPCSPACENCYAAAWARRFGQSFEPHTTKQVPPRKGIVFCGNMTDLFGEWLRPIDSMYFVTCAECGNKVDFGVTYLWLTKRVDEMNWTLNNMPRVRLNHYFGFTAENQEWYDKRRLQCVDMPQWANSWLSLEPLLGSINYLLLNDPIVKERTKWVVVGCESGPNRRPCKIEWVESIVDQCMAAKVPVFVKQLDINGRCETDINRFPAHLRIRQVPWAKENQP